MTIAFRALFIAIFAAIKRWKIVFFLFCFNLLFGLLVALPLISEIGGQAGRFGGLGGFIEAFDPEVYLDFMNQGEGAAAGAAAQTGIWGLVYFFLFNVLTAGAIVILADTRERTRLKSFFRACGAFCFRFFRLLFYYGLLLAAVALLNGLLNGAVCWLFEDFLGYGAGSETLGWILFSKNILMLIVLVFALLSFNYAKTATVIEDGHFMGYYFLRGMGFTLAHPLATGLFFVLTLVPLFLVILLYVVLSRGVDPQASYPFLQVILPWDWSISGSAYYILIAQIIQFLLQACLVLRFAGQVYIFKRFMVFTAHPDPDLQKSIPESYFVVDKPDPEGTAARAVEGKSYA